MESNHSNAFLTGSQFDALQKGQLNRVPLLIGGTSEEWIWKGSCKLFLLKKYFSGT